MTDKIKSNNFSPAVFPADILYDSNLKSSERLVLIILFTYTNAHTNTAWPSYNTIADRAGLKRRVVINIVNSLIIKGYIVKREQFRKSDKPDSKLENTSNLYTLFFKPIKDISDAKSAPPLVQNLHHPSAKSAPPLVQNLHHPSAKSAPKLSNELSSINDDDKLNEKNDDEGGIENHYQYEELAKRLGASKNDLAKCLKKLEKETDVATPMAWLTVALKNEVANRKLLEKTKPHPLPKKKKCSTITIDNEIKEDKYESFYL